MPTMIAVHGLPGQSPGTACVPAVRGWRAGRGIVGQFWYLADMAVNVDLANPDFYINREISFLRFNRRVLEQAKNPDVPLLERLRFLCITSSNLDEFFEIRVAGLKQRNALGSTQRGPENLTPAEQLRAISAEAHDLVDEQYRVLNDILFPALEQEGVRFLDSERWDKRQRRWLKRYFNYELEPILTPIGLDPAHPFPRLLNKNLTFIVTLEGKDAFGRSSGMAIVQAPRALPRVVRLPETNGESSYEMVFLSSIIDANVDELFSGMRVTGCYQFRVTRNSDLFVDEEEVDDLLRAVEGELLSRRFGDAVRLELDEDCPADVAHFLQMQFNLGDDDVYRCDGPVNLMRLNTIPDEVARPELKYAGFTPRTLSRIQRASNLFAAIREGDILLHHPFDSFLPVIDFLRQAATDPAVLSIRQTLYRTGADSAVVSALIEAAANGKEVLVVIELRARFDEEANIELANSLQEVGAQVVYGVVGFKTHAKMSMVIRREGKRLARYAHVGTGNYHTRTARLYTDYGLFTCDPAITRDVEQVFKQLTTMGKAGKLKKMLQAPFTLQSTLHQHIESEIANAEAGRPARLIAKMNALIDPETIRVLYRASQAGVKVDLIVRGLCALRPGIEGVSENIRVISVIGRFLEHTRVFYFEHGGEPLMYISSADWMQRNFFDRVETCIPIEDESLRDSLMRDIKLYLDDTAAWELDSDGGYERRKCRRKPLIAQEQLLEAAPG